MNLDDDIELSICAECGAEIDVEMEPGFPYTPQDVLCRDCATRRGGRYDEMDDRWVQPPDLTGLPGQSANL